MGHGASWTFVIWGFYHGFFLVLERTPVGAALDKLPRPLRHGYALLAVLMGWVLFRANTFPEAAHYFTALSGLGQPAHAQPLARYLGNEAVFALGLGLLFSMPLWAAIKNTGAKLGGVIPAGGRGFYFGLGQVIEILLVVVLLVISAAWLAGGTYNPFIYFRF